MKSETRLIDFLRTRFGVPLLRVGALLLFFAILPSSMTRNERRFGQSQPMPVLTTASSKKHISLTRRVAPVTLVPIKRETVTVTNQPKQSPVLFSVRVFPNAIPAQFVPPGRLVQCQLVNTLESLAPNTPVSGLTTEDLWFNGELFIPAGSEVHGQAQVDRVRERVQASGKWTVVLPSGASLTLSGTALDRE